VMGADIKNFLTQNNLAFMAKPFDIESLQEKISAIMNSSRPENDISGGSST
jgi:DNA-binding response OmpR family regulator